MRGQERERERERELSDLSQSGSGKAGMGTGEEDTAHSASLIPRPPPSTPPPSHTEGQDIICASVSSLVNLPVSGGLVDSDCRDQIVAGSKRLIFFSVSD